jgi:hypothetical protein
MASAHAQQAWLERTYERGTNTISEQSDVSRAAASAHAELANSIVARAPQLAVEHAADGRDVGRRRAELLLRLVP